MNRKASWHLLSVVIGVAILLSLAGCGGAATPGGQGAGTPGAGPFTGQATVTTEAGASTGQPAAPTATQVGQAIAAAPTTTQGSEATAAPAASQGSQAAAAAPTASQGSQDNGTRTITDMSGRQVVVPAQIHRILAVHPVASYMLNELAPDKLVSVDKLFRSEYLAEGARKSYSDADVQRLSALPVTAVFFQGVNPEQILKLKPDVVVTIVRHPNLDEFAAQLGVPVVTFAKDSLPLYAKSLRMLGTLVGNEDKADKLADYWEATLKQVTDETAKVPAEQRLRVYYANSGILTTPGPASIMASIMNLAGGNNVGKGLTDRSNEDIEVSLEQVISWDPEVIFVGTASDKQKIMSDPGWAVISAVKNNRVYVRLTYGSTDGIEALMGLLWAQNMLLHPGDAAADQRFTQTMKEYYALFFNYQITPAEITEVNP